LDKLIVDDMTRVESVALDNMWVNGTGSGGQPYGFTNNTSFNQITGCAAGAVTWSEIVGLEQTLLNAFAIQDPANVKFLSSPQTSQALRTTTRIVSSEFPVFLMSDDERMLNYEVVTNPVVSQSLSYSGTPNLSSLFLGQWSTILLGWFGVSHELVVDVFSGAASGLVNLYLFSNVDTGMRHPQSIAQLIGIAG